MTAWLLAALVLLGLGSTAHANHTRTIWDVDFNVAFMAFPASGNQTLVAVDMRDMLLYPPDDLPFLPAAFDPASIPSNSLLQLINCTILTTCPNFDAYINHANQHPDWMNSTSASYIAISANGGSLQASFTVISFRRVLPNNLTVMVSNLLLFCNVISGSMTVPRAAANSSATFRSAVLALSLLGTDGHVSIQGTVSVSRSVGWPPFGYVWRIQNSANTSPALLFDGEQPDPALPNASVLNFGMGSTVLQLGNQVQGSVTLRDLVLENLCQENLSLTPTYSAYMSFMLPAFGGDRVQLAVNNSRLVVSRSEVDILVYWLLVGGSRFESLRGLAADLLVSMSPAGAITTNGMLALSSLVTPRGTFTNLTLQADDLAEPLGFISSNPLGPTQCATRIDGSPVPVSAVPPYQPLLFVVNDTSALGPALQAISSSQALVSLLVLVQLIDSSLSSGTTSIQQDLLWLGPRALGLSSAATQTVTLDLAQRNSAVVLLGGAHVYLQHVTLVNPLEGALPGQTTAPFTAVPLWAFQFARNDGDRLVMADVHMQLPVASFAPLFALAWIGGLDQLAAARLNYSYWPEIQHPVLDGLSEFNVTWFNQSGIRLSNYSGWGWCATDILITPDTPLTDDSGVWLHSPPPPTPAVAPPGGQAGAIAVIIGVVLGVSGTLAIVAAVWFTIWFRRKKKREAQAALDHNEKATFTSLQQVVSLSDKGERSSKPQEVLAEYSGNSTSPDADRPTGMESSQHRGQEGEVAEAEQAQYQPQAPAWDPMKEVEQLVGVVQGQQNETLQLLEPIGTGGFGTVYRGRWRNLDVAVKTVLFTNKQGMAEMVGPERRAIMEAAACSSVVHPNVVATYHYDIKMVNTISQEGALQIKGSAEHSSDWKLFLVQELCDVSLADAVEASVFHDPVTRQPKLPLVFSVLEHIAAGMAYIHSKNVIHGDLKPENVLLKHDSSTEYGVVAKITDFGLCSTIDPTKSHISGFNNGTPFYVAPEISLTGRAEKQSDVFSFGILLVEVYRGVPPWIKTPKGFRHNKDFLNFPPDTPQRFLALIKSCLDRKARKRPQFSEICEELKATSQLVHGSPSATMVPPAPAMPSAPPAPPGAAAGTAMPATAAPSTPTAAQATVITHQALVSGRGSRQLASQQPVSPAVQASVDDCSDNGDGLEMSDESTNGRSKRL